MPTSRLEVIDAGHYVWEEAPAEYASSGGAERALSTVGFRAVRTLAERGGLTFVEGVKAAG